MTNKSKDIKAIQYNDVIETIKVEVCKCLSCTQAIEQNKKDVDEYNKRRGAYPVINDV